MGQSTGILPSPGHLCITRMPLGFWGGVFSYGFTCFPLSQAEEAALKRLTREWDRLSRAETEIRRELGTLND